MTEIRLGTRGSQLALWQAHAVANRIQAAGGPSCQIVVIKTSGDRLQDAPLTEVGGKRLFVKEIEDALLRREVDLAVHSCKDMPAQLPDGLTIAGVLPREDPHDAVVLPTGSPVIPEVTDDEAGRRSLASALGSALGNHPSLGTGSVRRIAQLTRLIAGATFAPIRGNLDTRLRKLDAGDYKALVLAAAGLRRLGFASRISATLPASVCVPAPGQGIVTIEIREDDRALQEMIATVTDTEAASAMDAERALVQALGGGCQTPVGAIARGVDRDTLELLAVVVSLDGSREVRAYARGPRSDAAGLGARVGQRLLADGADDILAEAHGAHGPVVNVEGIQP